MRKSFPALLALAMLPAMFVVAPTVDLPTPSPRPVAPAVRTIALHSLNAFSVPGPAPLSASGPARPVVLTAPITTEAFQLVGVTWPASEPSEGLQVAVRLHDDRGWSDWQQLDVSDIGPNAGTAEAAEARFGTEPLVADPSDGVQVRVESTTGAIPRDLRLSLIDPGTSPADAHLADPGPPAAAAAVASQPTIITRSQWGADESLRNGSASYSPTIKVGFVHHTVTSNTYVGTAGAAAQIRAIYAYDTNGLGWSDIAYNFLVDKDGNIYEGRAGGITKAVIGAHTAGFNYDTFAVAALGCFDTSCSSKLGGPATPSPVMLDSIAAVMAWKLGLFFRDPQSTQTLVSAGITGTNTRYPRGTTVTLQALSKHNDVGSTACPGNLLRDYVHTTIAAKAHDLQGPMLYDPVRSVSARAWGAGGVTLSARVPATQDWSMQVLAAGSATPIRSYTGSADGAFSVTWDGKTAAGAWAPPGVYQIKLSSGATYTTYLEVLPAPGAPKPPVRRVFGDDRYATAVGIGTESYPSSRTVVVVNGETAHLVDGLVAAPLARAAGGPILLTHAGSMPSVSANEVARRKATKAYLVGGADVVSASVVSQLRGLGVSTIERLDGLDRYATAANVARAVKTLKGKTPSVVVASGDQAHLIDAAAAGGPAAATGAPILLTTQAALPGATSQALGTLAPTRSYVLGTADVVSDAVMSALPSPTRLGGADRYATAAKIATQFASTVSPSTVVLASGADANLIDSLAGGSLGRITLLSSPSGLTSTARTWIEAHPVTGALLLGGRDALSTSVLWTTAVTVAG